MTTVHVDISKLWELIRDTKSNEVILSGSGVEGTITVIDSKGLIQQKPFNIKGKIGTPGRATNSNYRITFEFPEP